MPLLKTYSRAKKELLINVIGNICSGKSIFCNRLSERTGIVYKEINSLGSLQERMIIESSGLNGRMNVIKGEFKKVISIKLTCDEKESLNRIEKRDQEGYIYPINTRSPKEFYFKLRDKIDSINSDYTFESNEMTVDSMINDIEL